MKTKNLLLITIIVVLNSCSSAAKFKENTIIGSWKASDVTVLESKSPSEKLILHFYPDATYSTIKGKEVKFGEWNFLNEKEIKYGNSILTIEDFENDESKKSLIVSVLDKESNAKSQMTLVETFRGVEDYKEDPFHPDNNKWRLKPNKKETDKEIRDRLSNYLLHNAYILKAAYDGKENTISFKNSKGLIKIYESAIGVVKEDKIKESWVDCFYDKEDAMKAFHLYSNYLGERGVYKVGSTGDWVKDDYSALMSLYSKIQHNEKDKTMIYVSNDNDF